MTKDIKKGVRAINILYLLLIVNISVLIFILSINFKDNTKRFYISVNNKIKDKPFYEKVEEFLSKNGVNHMFGKIEPTQYILFKLISALILLALILPVDKISAVLMSLGMLILPDIILKISNESDNDEIIKDLKRVYDTLKIQTKSGVFITNALTECYLTVTNTRLKNALLELTNSIMLKSNISEAIEKFNSQFDNEYIDTFCIVIKQSIESGKSAQLLDDLSNQISDIQEALQLKHQRRIDSKSEMLQLLLYIGVIGIVLFGIVSEFATSLTRF